MFWVIHGLVWGNATSVIASEPCDSSTDFIRRLIAVQYHGNDPSELPGQGYDRR